MTISVFCDRINDSSQIYIEPPVVWTDTHFCAKRPGFQTVWNRVASSLFRKRWWRELSVKTDFLCIWEYQKDFKEKLSRILYFFQKYFKEKLSRILYFFQKYFKEKLSRILFFFAFHMISHREGVRQQTWAFLISTFRDLFISGVLITSRIIWKTLASIKNLAKNIILSEFQLIRAAYHLVYHLLRLFHLPLFSHF